MADRILTIDIETDNLLSGMLDYSSFPYKLLPSAKLHCVVVRDVNTGETWSAEKESVTRDWLAGILKGCTHLVAHNGISFDFPALKLFGVLDYRIGYLDQPDTVFGQPCQIVDTLLLSRLLSPDRYTPEGMGHSLAVWGERLGEEKSHYRAACVAAGFVEKNAPKGAEFLEWTPLLLDYCIQDTVVTCKLFQRLWAEYLEYSGWHQAFKMESKLCDLGVRREHLGFAFDVEKAKIAVADLQEKMKAIADAINPILPPKPRNKGELAEVTPPANQLKTHKAVYLPKVQIKKDGKLSSALVKFLNNQEEIEYVEGDFSFVFGGQTFQLPYYEALVPEFTEPSDVMLRFIERVGATIEKIDEEWLLFYKGQMYPLPYNEPLESHVEADINDIDWVKSVLISKNWQPTEFRVRNLICDSKKQSIPYEKRLAALQRYVKETIEDGKYKEQRLEILELNEENLFSTLAEKIKGNRPVVVPTSPCIRVGVEKELCPSLVKIGEKVAFAKDFALYLTYKHRKNSIAGGVDDEEWEFNEDNPPNSGYLNQYRQVDGRIPAPAIEIGAASHRYRHIGITNIPRVTSTYGFQMRELFGCGAGAFQFSYDFSSLEAMVMALWCLKYTNGEELAKDLVAVKPNDIHCYSEDTQILTPEGWKFFNELVNTTQVAQYDVETKRLSFVLPQEIVWQKYDGQMVRICNSNTDQLLTPNHRVLLNNYKYSKKNRVVRADELCINTNSDLRIPTGGNLDSLDFESEDFLKLVVATQADGHFSNDCSAIVFNFTKERKIERLKTLLDNIGAAYTTSFHKRKGREETIIRLNASQLTLKLRFWLPNKEFSEKLISLSTKLKLSVVEELEFWDGTRTKSGVVFETTSEKSVDMVQLLCHTSNIKCTKTEFIKKTSFGIVKVFRAFVSKERCWTGIHNAVTIEDYSGMVGCVSVPSGFVMVRRNNKVFISGNTKNSIKLGIPRSDAKSLQYALIYGCQPAKVAKMLSVSLKEGQRIYDEYWQAVPALKELRDNLEKHWNKNGKTWIRTIDGRKINTRSKHSLLNFLFQSTGIICAKYTNVLSMQILEEKGYCIDCFEGEPDVAEMIHMHDEQALRIKKHMVQIKKFASEEEGRLFVENWKGEQISPLMHDKNWYIVLPNDISRAISDAILKTEKLLKLSVHLQTEIMVNYNWAKCH